MHRSLKKAGTLLVAGLAFAACSTDSNDSPLSPPLGMAVVEDGHVTFEVCKIIVTSFPPPPGEVMFDAEGVGEVVTFELTPGGTQTVIAANGTGQSPVAQCDRSTNPQAFTEEIKVPIGGELTITELAETAGGTLTLVSSAMLPFPTSFPGCDVSTITRDGQTVTVASVGDVCTPEEGEPYKFIFKNTFEPGHDETGMEGCTPGGWRNNYDGSPSPNDWWENNELDPDDRFTEVWGVTAEELEELGLDPALTLLEALNIDSGRNGLNFLKHATAALLNSLDPDVAYPYTEAEVRADFETGFDALLDGERPNDIKDKFDAANNLGCDQ